MPTAYGSNRSIAHIFKASYGIQTEQKEKAHRIFTEQRQFSEYYIGESKAYA